MKELLQYAVESVVATGTLYGCYRLLLDRRVGYGLCRAVLIGSLVVGSLIPLLEIPVWPGRVVEVRPTAAVSVEPLAEALPEAPAFDERSLVWLLYGAVVAVLAAMMLRQVVRIFRLHRGADVTRCDGYRLVRTLRRISSFAFLRSIYLWRGTPEEEVAAIVAHETSHIARRHTIERPAVELLKALLWWNPFAWLTARTLAEVEEFEADRDVLRAGFRRDTYMTTIYRQLVGYSPDIANGLPHSLTGKRFEMMLKPIVNRGAVLRLAAVVPVLGALLCAFSFTAGATEYRTVAEEPAAVSAPPTTAASLPAASTPGEEGGKTGNWTVIVRAGGLPVAGALITVPGMTLGTVTDVEGKATLRVASGTTVEISYVGMKTLTHIVRFDGGKDDWTMLSLLSLDPDDAAAALLADTRVDEIVVTAYAPQSGPDTSDTPETAEPSAEKEPYLVAERMPRFEGGDLNTFRNWVSGQVRYPEAALDSNIVSCRVVVSFTIDREGFLKQIRILQSPDRLFSDEVRRALEQSPRWTPGMQDGRAVAVTYTLPVDFRRTEIEAEEPHGVDFRRTDAEAGEPEETARELQPDDRTATFRGGGLAVFRNWIMTQVRYPEELLNRGVEGTVRAAFIVDRFGRVGSIRILQTPDRRLSDEVVRALGRSPRWEPAVRDGRAVNMRLTLPILFRIRK